MNYTEHYNRLIKRAKNRKHDGYVEKHHIIPKCIGGGNNKENLVELTPEEHYVAHQLLLKMYPEEQGLIYAAMLMTLNSDNHQRNNKLYGWLKRKHANYMSISQKGRKNSQYGTCWVSNLETKESKKIKVDELDTYLSAGWIKKRIINWENYDSNGKNKCRFIRIHNKKLKQEKQIKEDNLQKWIADGWCVGKTPRRNKRVRKHIGMSKKKKATKKLIATDDKVYEIYKATKSLRKTAKHFNVSHTTIKRRMDKLKGSFPAIGL